MKIEKINDKQIRCTLTKEDLANREIKISELAYGSEKAKALFQDMMQIAADDFGFEADNIPLVIEAVPVSMDTLILIITKVEDPEELDTRFAKFSPEDMSSSDAGTAFANLKEKMEGADDILDLIRKLSEAKKRAMEKAKELKKENAPDKEASANAALELADDEELNNLTRAYLFFSLDDAIHAAGILGTVYNGPNTLFKNTENGNYYLLLKKASSSAEEFNKVCNVLSEYSLSCKYTPGLDAYFSEHMETIIKDQALQSLYQIR